VVDPTSAGPACPGWARLGEPWRQPLGGFLAAGGQSP